MSGKLSKDNMTSNPSSKKQLSMESWFEVKRKSREAFYQKLRRATIIMEQRAFLTSCRRLTEKLSPGETTGKLQ